MLCKTVSSLQPDVGRGFLHVSNVFLFISRIDILSISCDTLSASEACHEGRIKSRDRTGQARSSDWPGRTKKRLFYFGVKGLDLTFVRISWRPQYLTNN